MGLSPGLVRARYTEGRGYVLKSSASAKVQLARVLQHHARLENASLRVEAQPRTFDEQSTIFDGQTMSVFPSRARLGDGRKLPVAYCQSLGSRGRLLGVNEHRPTENDEPSSNAHTPHGGDANRYRRRWLSLAALLLVTQCTQTPVTYADYGDSAVTTLQREFYTGYGTWYACASTTTARLARSCRDVFSLR
jgi:hypothetical protein